MQFKFLIKKLLFKEDHLNQECQYSVSYFRLYGIR